MTPLRLLLAPVRVSLAAFRAGAAPRVWRRTLVRATDWGAVNSGWLAAFWQELPPLSRQPLYGPALVELAEARPATRAEGEIEHRSQPAPVLPDTGRPRRRRPRPALPPGTTGGAPAPSPPARAQETRPARLPQGQLQRLAGPLPPPAGRRPAGGQPRSGAGERPARIGNGPAGRARPRRRSQPPAPSSTRPATLPPAPARGWQRLLVEGIRARLQTARSGPGGQGAARRRRRLPSPPPTLLRQWTQTGDGPRAPDGLLRQLAGYEQPPRSGRRAAPTATREGRQHPAAEPVPAKTAAPVQRAPADRPETYPHTPPATAAQSRRDERGLGENLVPVARVDPPLDTPTWPPLRPPQANGVPPLGVAAAGAPRSTRPDHPEAQAATEMAGLHELAADIKRILDEEARRHGIDV